MLESAESSRARGGASSWGGLSNKEVARELRLSEGTVKIHLHHILRKLGAKSRYSLIVRLLSAAE
ncbi:MAG: LuxR C-terminal-related transcriptional regulator [Steroidobacteraceae bacterium]